MDAPKHGSLNFKILPATVEDCLTLANIEAVANHEASKAKPDSKIARILLGPPGNQSFRTRDLVDKMRNDPILSIWKVVIGSEGEEKIIAYAFWNFYTEAKPIEEWKDIDWPAQANRGRCNQFMASVVAMRKKHVSGRKFGLLQVLATRREYRGHGIGSALIIKGLEEGIKLELTEFWLEASPDGYRLYEKFGFRDVEAIPVDLSKYGGVGMAQLMAMKKSVIHSTLKEAALRIRQTVNGEPRTPRSISTARMNPRYPCAR